MKSEVTFCSEFSTLVFTHFTFTLMSFKKISTSSSSQELEEVEPAEEKKPKLDPEEERRTKLTLYKILLSDNRVKISILPTIIIGAIGALYYLFFAPFNNKVAELQKNPVENPMKEIIPYIICGCALALVYASCKFIDTWCWNQAGSNMMVKLRKSMFASLMKCDLEFYDKNPIGEIFTLLSEDVKTVQGNFGCTKGLQLQNMGQLVICTITAFIFSWKIGFILLFSSILLFITTFVFLPILSSRFIEKFVFIGNMITIAQESLSSIRTVRSYNQEDSTFERFRYQSNEGSSRESFVLTKITYMYDIMNVFFYGAYVVVYYYGSVLLRKGEESFGVGELLATTCMTFAANSAIGIINYFFYQEAKTIEAGARIMKVINTKPNIPYDDGIELPEFTGHIEFRNVSFKYPTRDVYALKNVSFEVKPGQIIALVGHSGSGKSTCIQLIERFYDVTEGEILVDGHNIKSLNPRWLHQKIGLVAQDSVLFNASVKENILYGARNATEEQIIDAVNIANARKFIEKFPNKYDEIVGGKGLSLSGGQRQRIAIARAVIKDPVVLMTDEATSALDTGSERKVQMALDEVMKTRTSIVVAHRLTTIKIADLIYVFSDGEIKESGSHTELLALKGFYLNLIEKQLEGSQIE